MINRTTDRVLLSQESVQHGRRIFEYPKTTHGMRSTVEKWGVDKHKDKPLDRLLLITGTGRCGTTWWARALQSVGLDVQHEKTGEHGTASLFFTAPDSDWYPRLPWLDADQKNHVGERKSDFRFKHVVQVVRNPLTCIPSMGPIFPSVNYEFFEMHGIIPPDIKPRLLRCAHAWYNLNRLAEEQSEYRWRLEDQNDFAWNRVMVMWGARSVQTGRRYPYPNLKPVNRGTGFRKSQPTTIADLAKLDRLLATNIQKMGRKYGYRL